MRAQAGRWPDSAVLSCLSLSRSATAPGCPVLSLLHAPPVIHGSSQQPRKACTATALCRGGNGSLSTTPDLNYTSGANRTTGSAGVGTPAVLRSRERRAHGPACASRVSFCLAACLPAGNLREVGPNCLHHFQRYHSKPQVEMGVKWDKTVLQMESGRRSELSLYLHCLPGSMCRPQGSCWRCTHFTDQEPEACPR